VSKQLQVLLPDSEIAEIRRLARLEQVTVGEWVRRALHAQFKLRTIHKAVEYSFPTADIDRMLREIKK
jgi:hypothetical protein